MMLVIYMVFKTYTWSNKEGPPWLNELGSGLPNNSYKPITNTACGITTGFINYKKGCTRPAFASDKV